MDDSTTQCQACSSMPQKTRRGDREEVEGAEKRKGEEDKEKKCEEDEKKNNAIWIEKERLGSWEWKRKVEWA